MQVRPDGVQSAPSRRARLFALAPARQHWLGVVLSPSGSMLLFSVLFLALAKISVVVGFPRDQASPTALLQAICVDVAVHFALIAALGLAEAFHRRIIFVTVTVAAFVSAQALVNAQYLSITGEQLSWEAISYGIERFDEMVSIVAEGGFPWGFWVGVVLVCGVIPAWCARLARGHRTGASASTRSRGRAHAASLVVIPALAFSLWAGSSRFVPLRMLEGNAIVDGIAGWRAPSPWTGMAAGFDGYEPAELAVDDRQPASRPNVLVIVLESVRYDFTSLANPNAPAATPNLLALARRGTSAPSARAVVPHTSKSLFSIFCGRIPLLERRIYENSAELRVQCMPSLLEDHGYDTVFLQSALGNFESRPRLVSRFGFADFRAWEEIGGQPSGYFGSDDESLAPAMEAWLDERSSSAPFFATLLTSTTHHPYRLTDRATERAKASGLAASSDPERYTRLIEAQDYLLGAIDQLLARRGLRENTVVAVVGDHGEGFGAKGIRMHDNNFFEEGLRVPFVIAGPGVPIGQIAGNVSLVDLMPTILELAGLPLRDGSRGALPGASIFDENRPAVPRPFACFYDDYCYGYVVGDQKVIYGKSAQRWRFDLAGDPDERRAEELDEEMRSYQNAFFRSLARRRSAGRLLELGTLESRYGQWSCPVGQPCVHPRTPEGGFF